MCKRRIDFHRLKRLVTAFLLGHDLDRAHIVQPVGQLDDDDPHILRHSQQHLSDVLRLPLLTRGLIADLPQLGHAVHQQGDIAAKLP